jgi:hypothetical protein
MSKTKTLKVYQSKSFTTYTAVLRIGDQVTDVTFNGGISMPFTGGKFSTTDPAIQQALESREDFNKKFLIVYVSPQEPAPKKKAEQPQEVTTQQAVVDNGPTEGGEAEITPAGGYLVPGIDKFQTAKSWIAKNIEGVKHSDIPNKAAVKEVMRLHDITFPDLDI